MGFKGEKVGAFCREGDVSRRLRLSRVFRIEGPVIDGNMLDGFGEILIGRIMPGRHFAGQEPSRINIKNVCNPTQCVGARDMTAAFPIRYGRLGNLDEFREFRL